MADSRRLSTEFIGQYGFKELRDDIEEERLERFWNLLMSQRPTTK